MNRSFYCIILACSCSFQNVLFDDEYLHLVGMNGKPIRYMIRVSVDNIT